MSRTPPSSSRSGHRKQITVLAFSKEGRTVYSRLIRRKHYLVTRQDSREVDAIEYDRHYWPIYMPETFAERSSQWVEQGDTLYGPDLKPLPLPLKHPYLFECDKPYGSCR